MINLLDHFYHPQYKFKAAGLATYGASSGGARSAYVLRNTASELGMIVSPTNWWIPNVWGQVDHANGGVLKDDNTKSGMNKFLTEFLFLADTLKSAKANAPK